MQEGVTNEGKRYIALSDAEIEQMPPTTRIYHLENGIKAIAPQNCCHDYYISGGVPMNIKGCNKCIYWEFTNEQPTE